MADFQRKPKKWLVFFIIILAAAGTIIYVGNVISVDRTLTDIQSLKKRHLALKNDNELLKSKLHELEAAERITSIAQDKLGMVRATEAPSVLP